MKETRNYVRYELPKSPTSDTFIHAYMFKGDLPSPWPDSIVCTVWWAEPIAPVLPTPPGLEEG